MVLQEGAVKVAGDHQLYFKQSTSSVQGREDSLSEQK